MDETDTFAIELGVNVREQPVDQINRTRQSEP